MRHLKKLPSVINLLLSNQNMTDLSKIKIELLSPTHKVESFCCGYESLDKYVQSYATANASRGLGRTFVAIENNDSNVIGYYTLTVAEIAKEKLPKKQTRGLPGYPIPAILLARLAVDKSAQGRKLGEFLLFDAFSRVVRGSYDFGIRLIVVDAIDEKAKAFYLRYGFVSFDDNPLKLFLPLKVIENLVK